ncbi:MAG: A/G-specific adenine glycosylase [Gammaproteobacteria bacterium HGW-Gammaproteobacteria-3]|jgi:A/G-specific adenine glycosylase|nr:MAG: A/G-specific adenine glycosylase [Gammaproteobacteria bacterium HGW-Gammaproteobacteria-3]
MEARHFQQQLLAWFDRHGRKDLPWQNPVTPYRVWISEIMLQQTQVTTVIPYFNRFIERFPEVETLAQAPVDSVLQLWAGLGYYARARNLHKSARLIVEQGFFPDSLEALMALPGIGRSTAGAILSIACRQSQPILDGNVKRVLARYKGLSGWPGESRVSKALWAASTDYTPEQRVADYTQAMMDLGATLCTRTQPKCPACPLASDCVARIEKKTTALPTPKPSRKQAVKQLYFLCLTDRERRTLLELRPATGIWGGLWSLPEFDSIEAIHNWCLSRHIDIKSQTCLPSRRHSFSHFHLDYTPLCINTDNPINFVMEGSRAVWYKPEQIETLALAAPIKRLLQLTRG